MPGLASNPEFLRSPAVQYVGSLEGNSLNGADTYISVGIELTKWRQYCLGVTANRRKNVPMIYVGKSQTLRETLFKKKKSHCYLEL